MQEKETFEIDIKNFLGFLVRKSWIIILAAIAVGGLALSYAKLFITPLYAASIRLYVNNIYLDNDDKEEIQAGQLTAAYYLAEAYMVILEGKPVLNEVLEATGLQDKYTPEQLRSMVSADTINDTEIFQVTVRGPDSAEAALIANAFAEILPKKLPEVVQGSDVRLVDYAVESKETVFPEYFENTLIAALLGVIVSLIIIVLREYLDDTIDSDAYLTTYYQNIPLLAVVPDAQEIKGKGYRKYKNYYKRYYKSYYTSGKKEQSGGRGA